MTWQNGVGGGEDPVYRCRWAGSSVGGPDGNKRWGLDAEDSVLTGNRVCMDTYLRATQEYINHCKANGYPTKVFFTTGPVDGTSGELAYQRYLKHEHIRNYVKNSTDGILFDYADILSWSDSGEEYTISWTDLGGTYHSFQHIHPDNMLDLDGSYTEDGDHIGQRGALRLAKAMWYMLARIAGWDGILGVEEDGKFEAKDFLLRQNYPNPFHITTTISYRLPTRGYVRLTIYDFLGREIKALVDGMRESSEQKVEWDGKNTQGEQVASGIYFYQLKTSSGFISTKKMLLIR
ncbi:MAG: T9SS type A sorting domain-containing protein [candidate division WOR-3 bacterium]